VRKGNDKKEEENIYIKNILELKGKLNKIKESKVLITFLSWNDRKRKEKKICNFTIISFLKKLLNKKNIIHDRFSNCL